MLSEIPYEFLISLLRGNAAAIMYYVFVYCLLTLLIPVLDRLANSRYKYLGFLFTPIEIIMRLLPLLGLYTPPRIISLTHHVYCLGFVSFFYLGYLLGNGYLNCTISTKRLVGMITIAILLQMAEGYGYFQISPNAGTAMKLSAALTSSLCCLLLYRFIDDPTPVQNRLLKLLGDHSFGIFFAHLMIRWFIRHIPGYETYLPFPINGLLILGLTLALMLLGKRILGRYAKYLAF